jgi:beta-lactamase superfamily II metal-dependent hydrolase
MPYKGSWNSSALNDDMLAVFVLNVGHGDAIVVRFPTVDDSIICAVVDCYLYNKTKEALKSLHADSIAFMCATHPHSDHMLGFEDLIEWCLSSHVAIDQFWDSGFRHVTSYHYDLIRCLQKHPEIAFLRLTSGFEITINGVRVLALAPSIRLKNKYDTFGTEINNASIVLKLEYPAKDVAKYYAKPHVYSDGNLAEEEKIQQNTMILGGDAQFDSWAHLVQEFPQQTRYKSTNRGQFIPWKDWSMVTHKPFLSQVLKVPHHMSKNGISYEILNNIRPKYAIVSCSDTHKHNCPHPLTIDAAREVNGCKTFFTGNRNSALRYGTIAVLFSGDGSEPEVYSMHEAVDDDAPI